MPDFDVGTPVRILRNHGNLWGGCCAVVESVDAERVHTLVLQGKNGEKFRAEALSDELCVCL